MAATESWGMAGGSSQGHGKWTGWTKPGMTHLLLRSSTEGGILDGWNSNGKAAVIGRMQRYIISCLCLGLDCSIGTPAKLAPIPEGWQC